MEDRIISDKRAWDQACQFMATTVEERLTDVRKYLHESRGPSFFARWFKWQSSTHEHNVNAAIQQELAVILNENPVGFKNLKKD